MTNKYAEKFSMNSPSLMERHKQLNLSQEGGLVPTETDGQENQPPPTFENRGEPVIEDVSSDKRMISGSQVTKDAVSSQQRMVNTHTDGFSSKRMIRTDGFSDPISDIVKKSDSTDVVKKSDEDSASLVRIHDRQPRVQPRYYSRFMQKMYGGETNQEDRKSVV